MAFSVKISNGKQDFEDAAFIRTEVFIKEQGFEIEFDDIDEKAVHFVLDDYGIIAVIKKL